MSFKIEKTEEKKNPLINRVELRFRIDHFGASTPNRLDVKKKIAALQSSNEKLTIIKHLNTYFGKSYTNGIAYIYEDSTEMQFFEPFHILVRNLDKERRTEIYQLKRRKEPYMHLFKY